MSSLEELIKSIGDIAQFPITLSRYDNERKLIYVNQTFCNLTGYSQDFCIERNCKFLHGPETDPEAIKSMRKAFDDKISVFQDIVNYKKNGEKFINRLVLLTFDYGNAKYILGLQHEVEAVSEKTMHHGELNDKLLNPLSSMLIFAEDVSELDDYIIEKVRERLSYIAAYIQNL